MVSTSVLNFINFCAIVSFFFTKLLTLGILFSAVKLVVVTKLIILDILFLTSFIFVFRKILVTMLVTNS